MYQSIQYTYIVCYIPPFYLHSTCHLYPSVNICDIFIFSCNPFHVGTKNELLIPTPGFGGGRSSSCRGATPLILLFTYLHSQVSRKVQTQLVPIFVPGYLYSLNTVILNQFWSFFRAFIFKSSLFKHLLLPQPTAQQTVPSLLLHFYGRRCSKADGIGTTTLQIGQVTSKFPGQQTYSMS